MSATFEEWVDSKVARIMEKMKFEPGEGSKLPKRQRTDYSEGFGIQV